MTVGGIFGVNVVIFQVPLQADCWLEEAWHIGEDNPHCLGIVQQALYSPEELSEALLGRWVRSVAWLV